MIGDPVRGPIAPVEPHGDILHQLSDGIRQCSRISLWDKLTIQTIFNSVSNTPDLKTRHNRTACHGFKRSLSKGLLQGRNDEDIGRPIDHGLQLVTLDFS